MELYYETTGSGDIPVILVHGYGLSSVAWEKVMPLFPPEYRLYAIDLRGCGRSVKPDHGYSCPELADDIKDLMDSLNMSQAILMGHSFGGLVVQHFAARYSQRVRALVLSNVAAATLPPRGISPAVEKRIK